MAFTYSIRNEIDKTFTGKCENNDRIVYNNKHVSLDLTYTVIGDDYTPFQGIIFLILSILYTYVIIYKILA